MAKGTQPHDRAKAKALLKTSNKPPSYVMRSNKLQATDIISPYNVTAIGSMDLEHRWFRRSLYLKDISWY